MFMRGVDTLMFNVYWPHVLFLYPLKTLENKKFFDVFKGYRNGALG